MSSRPAPSFNEVAAARFSRRSFLQGATTALLLSSFAGCSKKVASATPIPKADQLSLREGHRASPLLRWGDPLFQGAPEFDPLKQSFASQSQQFGYNCDYVGFLSRSESSGLLVVNHEYTNTELMFPSFQVRDRRFWLTSDQVETEWAAIGMSVVELERVDGSWRVVFGPKNRRITVKTPMKISGPAAGHPRMKTSADPSGTRVLGTMANCSGGKTPWGTVLSGEENFQEYFGNLSGLAILDRSRESLELFPFAQGASVRGWERFDSRFDLSKEPNEANRFGWVVEVDPEDPKSTPVKRTALGRCCHEAATVTQCKDGRTAVYMGDDSKFQFVYKFVSQVSDSSAESPLDKGTLYVARFEDDGTGSWLPLIFGSGPLTPENGFEDQGDVLIMTRKAARLLGATPMDRPEDIEVQHDTARVFLVLTNNTSRGHGPYPGAVPSNPREENRHGHILELQEDGGCSSATRFRWEPFLVCGNPDDPTTYFAGFPKDQVATISCPDNLCWGPSGRLWIATDGMRASVESPDGLFSVPVDGPEKGKVTEFLRTVPGSEVCGPEFTPDGETLFLAIQHPGEGGTYAKPLCRFPDGQGPPRPTVVSINMTS